MYKIVSYNTYFLVCHSLKKINACAVRKVLMNTKINKIICSVTFLCLFYLL